MSSWAPVENPGTRPPRSRVFDVACTLLAAPTWFGSLLRPGGTIARSPVALSLVVAVMAGAVPAQWPVRSELFQVALASSFYTSRSRRAGSRRSSLLRPGGTIARSPVALSLVVAVMAGAVPAQWPVRSELFQVALASSFYTVAVTPSRITAFVAATLAAAAASAAGLPALLAPIYEVDRGSS